jgi:hypothetical protein
VAAKATRQTAPALQEAAFLAMERDGTLTGDLAEAFDADAYKKWRAKRGKTKPPSGGSGAGDIPSRARRQFRKEKERRY